MGSNNVTSQLSNEFARNDGKTKSKLIENAGLKSSVTLDNKNVLAMKVDCGLSFQQMRKARKYLKKDGVNLPSEKKQREMSNEITQDFITTQNNIFGNDIGDETEETVATVENLISFITNHLESLKHNNKLIWHNGIPENEIWVKFGGDHGKESFKLTLQVVNVEKPNSKTNTVVLAMAYVKDSYDNLSFIMSDIRYKLEDLSKLEWDGKTIKVFAFGDYDFYCKIFGLSGAQGTHPCLWCNISKKQIQSDQYHKSEPRTLESIKENCDKWEMETNADKKRASEYYNCVHRPMINIDLDRVVPPYLHILLGIMKKHHELLEIAADKLDDMIQNQHEDDIRGVKCSSLARSLMGYGGNWQFAEELNESIRFHEGVEVFSTNPSNSSSRKLGELRESLDNLPKKDLKSRTGPISSQLDIINKDNNVVAQKYHGRAYIGNHCHTYFMNKVYELCSDAIVKKTHELTKNTDILRECNQIKQNFDSMNTVYREVHIQISHSEMICEYNLQFIDTLIHQYMSLYRAFFPGKVIPKQHFLEYHCVPWIARYGFGLGLHGEQGGELIHSTISRAERSGRHIRNAEERIKTVMKTHFLMTAPSLNALRPPTQKRNKTKFVHKKLF